MTDPFYVLFLCTGNSARSVLAESILRKDGGGRFNCLFRRQPPQGPRPSPRGENTRSLRVSGRGISLEELGRIHGAGRSATRFRVLQPLKDRAERILKDLASRKTTGLAAMELLAVLATEREAAVKAAKESGLSSKAFGVFWLLRNDSALKSAGLDPMEIAREAEVLLERFPNASVNADEQRRLRAALYRPLLALKNERTRIVDLIVAIVTS